MHSKVMRTKNNCNVTNFMRKKNGQRSTFGECNPFCNAIKKLKQLPLSNMKMP